MAHLPRLLTVLLASGLAACGGKSFDTDPGSGGSGSNPGGQSSGGGGPAGSSSGGASNKAGTSWGGSGQGGSAGSVCESFDDEPGSFVQVAIINRTAAPIYLGQDMVTCGVSPLFQVATPDGVPLPGLSDCRSSCAQVRNGGPIGCPAICAYPSAISLQPGEVLYTSYSGLFRLERELPRECLAVDYGNQCEQAKQIQPGNFTFSAIAGLSIDCQQTTGGACGPCMPTGNGGCTTPGSLIAGQTLTTTTSVYLDASYGVYGSPQPPPAPAQPNVPGASDIQALLTVELIFSN